MSGFEDDRLISTLSMILWVLAIGVMGAWIMQRYARRKRKALIERQRDGRTDLK